MTRLFRVLAILCALFYALPALAQTTPAPGQANGVWRDWTVTGVPSSGAYNPQKSLIRQWGGQIEGELAALGAGQAGGAYAFDTLAHLNAFLTPGANAMATVFEDGTPTNDGIYQKVGATGVGSWTKVSSLIYGLSPVMGLGTVTVLACNETPYVTMTGTTANPLVNYGLPACNYTSAIPLPTPTPSARGGVTSAALVSHQWLQYLDTTGAFHLAQPDASDITGTGDVRSFAGVDVTGATDSTAALQTAANTGVLLRTHAGEKLKISGTVTFSVNGGGLVGDGYGSEINCTSTTADCIVGSSSGLTFSNLRFTAGATKASGSFINLNGANLAHISHLQMYGYFYGINNSGAGVTGTRIEDVSLFAQAGTSSIGILVNTSTQSVDFRMSKILVAGNGVGSSNQPATGIQVFNVGDLVLDQVQTIQAGQGLYISPALGQTVQALFVQNSYFDLGAFNGVYVAGAGTVQLLKISHSWAATNVGAGINLSSTGLVQQADIIDDVLSNNTGHGLLVNGPTITNVRVLGGSASNNTQYGYVFNTGASNFTVADVVAGPTGQFGGNTAGGIALGGSNTVYTIHDSDVTGNTGPGLSITGYDPTIGDVHNVKGYNTVGDVSAVNLNVSALAKFIGSGTSGSFDASLTATGGGSVAGQGDLISQSASFTFQGWDTHSNFRVEATLGSNEFWQATGGLTGAGPALYATSSSSTNVTGVFAAKGAGGFTFGNGAGNLIKFTDSGGVNTNYFTVSPGVSGASPLLFSPYGMTFLYTSENILFNKNTLNAPALPTNTSYVHLQAADGELGGVFVEAFGNSTQISGRRATGTANAPTALLSGAQILGLAAYGYGATGYSSTARGLVKIESSENWSDTAQGADVVIETTQNGTTTRAPAASFNHDKSLTVVGYISGGSAASLIRSSVALNNGAAAQTATMTNGPAAGNPTKWIPIIDNGTTRYIPAW